MKFVLNISFEPYFITLFDEEGRKADEVYWHQTRTSGRVIWNFFEKNHFHDQEISFCGGVSGPGGFTNLRIWATTLEAITFRFPIPIHSVRADIFIAHYLGHENFLLNSFGDKVFVSNAGNLTSLSTKEAFLKFKKTPLILDFLPEGKQKYFKKNSMKTPDWGSVLLKYLEQKTNGSKKFLVDYEFPAVQDNSS